MQRAGVLLCFASPKNCKIMLLFSTRLYNIHPCLPVPPGRSESSHVEISIVHHKATLASVTEKHLSFPFPFISGAQYNRRLGSSPNSLSLSPIIPGGACREGLWVRESLGAGLSIEGSLSRAYMFSGSSQFFLNLSHS